MNIVTLSIFHLTCEIFYTGEHIEISPETEDPEWLEFDFLGCPTFDFILALVEEWSLLSYK